MSKNGENGKNGQTGSGCARWPDYPTDDEQNVWGLHLWCSSELTKRPCLTLTSKN